MSAFITRWPLTVLAAGVVSLLVAGCVASGGGYGYDAGSFGPGYYEPYGVDYGGWDGGYRVGPVRGRGNYGGGRGGPHAYHGAPPSRPMPSIPSRPRPGGSGRPGGGARR